MQTLLFILVLGVLIFVHEMGHFLFAKLFGVRVDEFGFGYPPRLTKLFRWKGTDFTLNWIPFGGFVKIFGEQDEGEELSAEEKAVALNHQAIWKQILVMLGGILFNILFAWIIFSGILFFTKGEVPVSTAPEGYHFDTTRLVIVHVEEGMPAAESGIQLGDEIKEYYSGDDHVIPQGDTQEFSQFIQKHKGSDIGVIVYRDGKLKDIHLTPEESEGGEKYLVGVSLTRMGEVQLGLLDSLRYGAEETFHILKEIVKGFYQLVTGKLSPEAVSGPVGIVKQIGDAAQFGWVYLLSFTALLSLNLAVLNLIPFPALDGGRIFILLIEGITRRKIKPEVVAWIHTIGFFILIALMIFITYRDIVNW